MRRLWLWFGPATIAAALAGCGGGGGSSGSGSTPPVGVHTTAPTALTTVDCTTANGACPSITLAGDPPFSGGFHGYADPSMRHDPVSGVLELAYSWPHTLGDGSRVVDLHLAHSSNGGSTWSFDGALWSSTSFANPGGGAYAQSNDTSTETVNLLPIPSAGGTTWVQAHWSYLVQAGSTNIYGQTGNTTYISVSALLVPSGSAPSALLGLGTAPEARLGNAGTDPTLHATTNLSTLAAPYASCVTFQQPAMAYVNGTLYLAIQCSADGPPAFAVFATTPTGANATSWNWTYQGEIATGAQASALAASEGQPYTFFTELDFGTSKSGQLLAIVAPAMNVTGQVQPFEQYGCRAIPVTSLSTPALQTNGSGVPVVAAKVTESDLYTPPNEGNGACTYDSTSSTGIVIVHKLENDPTLGFYTTLLASKVAP